MRTGQSFRSLLLAASLWGAGCGATPASNPVASVDPPRATVVVGGTVELTGSATGYVEARYLYGYWGVFTTCPYQRAPIQCCWQQDPAIPIDPTSCPHGWISGRSAFLPVTATYHAPSTPQEVVLVFTSDDVLDARSTVRIPVTVVDPP
jgi:hypothetical protein